MGQVLGLGVLADTAAALRSALDWMPGRILVLAEEGLTAACQEQVVDSAHLSTLAGVVVLAHDEMDLTCLEQVACAIPVVRVARSHDQRCLRRAVRIGVEVRQGVPEVDLRAHPLPIPRLGGRLAPVRAEWDPPGTVPR